MHECSMKKLKLIRYVIHAPKKYPPNLPPPPLACLLFSKHYEKCVPTFFCMQALFNRLCPAKKGVRTFAPVMMKRLQV